jgi:hypothetical protein
MITIYSTKITPRLEYVLELVFSAVKTPYSIQTDKNEFIQTKTPKLNYSNESFENSCKIEPSPVLFDTGLSVYGITKGYFEQEECLLFNEKLDPFASIFYVVSRMEEYTYKKLDKHGRFEAVNSVMTRFDWMQKAMCDRWSNAIVQFLVRNAGLVLEQIPPKVNIIPTFDIDNAFAYKHKGELRKSLSIFKDFLKGDFFRIQQRTKVLLGFKKDPYDTFDKIIEIAKRGFSVKMFWLLGDYSKYDKNISHTNKMHQSTIQKMNEFCEVGIHPSYKSNSYELHLLHEKERLEAILEKEIFTSRQHFLKLSVKKTYPISISMGIRHDYTMGYAEVTGFRAGTCRPFYWYDLTEEKKTELMIHPFVYMDGTFNEYLKLTKSEAKKTILNLYNEIAKVGGDYVFIWHNETIGDYRKWKGWSEVLEYTLNLNTKNE